MKREPVKGFQDLIVWQKAHQFVLSIYVRMMRISPPERRGLGSGLDRPSENSIATPNIYYILSNIGTIEQYIV